MNAKRAPRRIFPKVSTMPRQQTEAAQYLDMYKLTVEKKRLQQELEYIDERRQRLCDRLDEINRETEGLDAQATRLRQPTQPVTVAKPSGISFAPTANVYLPERTTSAPDDYNTLMLDY